MDAFPEEFNLASWLLDERVAEGKGERVAVIDGEKRVTYRELQRLVNRVGNGLLELDVDMEDRVLIVLPDGVELIAAWLAAIKVGASVACVPARLTLAQYERLLHLTRARTLFIDASCRKYVEEAIPSSRHLRRVVTVGEPEGKQIAWEEFASSRFDELEAAPTHREDTAVWFPSTSAEEACHAVGHTHQALASSAVAIRQTLRLGLEDTILVQPSLSGAVALTFGVIAPLSAGASTALMKEDGRRPSMEDSVKRHHPTVVLTCSVLSTDPESLLLSRLLGDPGLSTPPWVDASHVLLELRRGLAGEGYFRALFTTAALQPLLGASEGTDTSMCGRPVEGCEARIVRKDGSQAATGEKGILWVRQPCVTPHFWHDEARARETLRDGWVKIGGAFSIDLDGYVWYQGALES